MASTSDSNSLNRHVASPSLSRRTATTFAAAEDPLPTPTTLYTIPLLLFPTTYADALSKSSNSNSNHSSTTTNLPSCPSPTSTSPSNFCPPNFPSSRPPHRRRKTHKERETAPTATESPDMTRTATEPPPCGFTLWSEPSGWSALGF
ncbi:hypothetical protein V8G54_018601 [Vigna mungo]|uniref:Uncharacterized protein n=1 Tax=Vigna mungo TaxID=3915 RepID=A0AAQ3N929_VIGMU